MSEFEDDTGLHDAGLHDAGLQHMGLHNTEKAGPSALVVPLNDAATCYETLAGEIEGSAVGWPDAALAQLERGLLERFGPSIGGRQAVRRLIRLAARPHAA